MLRAAGDPWPPALGAVALLAMFAGQDAMPVLRNLQVVLRCFFLALLGATGWVLTWLGLAAVLEGFVPQSLVVLSILVVLLTVALTYWKTRAGAGDSWVLLCRALVAAGSGVAAGFGAVRSPGLDATVVVAAALGLVALVLILAWALDEFGYVAAAFAAGAVGGALFVPLEALLKYLARVHRPDLMATVVPAGVLLIAVATVVVHVMLLGQWIDEGEREWWARLTAALAWKAALGASVTVIFLYVPALFLEANGAVNAVIASGWLGSAAVGVITGKYVRPRLGGWTQRATRRSPRRRQRCFSSDCSARWACSPQRC